MPDFLFSRKQLAAGLLCHRSEAQGADAEAWGHPSAQAEARALFGLVGRNGDTLETIRELIAIPEETAAALQAFAQAHPEERANIEPVLRFRREVQAEFDRLTGNARQ